ncbi:MAG: LysM repeat protein [Verrucomicrobiales bacterium]|jgi:LysM repeat protein
MNRLPAFLLAPLCAAGLISDSLAQAQQNVSPNTQYNPNSQYYAPAVARDTEIAIERMIDQRLSEQTSVIAELQGRIEHLERITYMGVDPGQTGGTGTSSQVIHTVTSGDTLYGIARRYGVDVNAIIALNQISPNQPIYINDRLAIPHPKAVQDGRWTPVANQPGNNTGNPYSTGNPNQQQPGGQSASGTYIVRPGDTLSRIARENRTSITNLMGLNGLNNPDQLQVGQTLVISGRAAAGPATPQGQGQSGNGKKEETYHYYEVVHGDSLEKVAKTFFTTVEEIRFLNRFGPDAKLKQGDKVMVPTSRYFQHLNKKGAFSYS